MADELIDVYDEAMTHLGTMLRDEAHRTGAWHRSIHCWVVRPVKPGSVLFQKRGRTKKLFPNALDITAAGHYTAGETARDGGREILEELGVSVPFEELIPLGIKMDVARIGAVINREFCDVFFLKRADSPSEYRLDPAEVEGLVSINIADGLALFSGGEKTAEATGVEWDSASSSWRAIRIPVSVADFIPRLDPYYLKVFLMAELMLAGRPIVTI